MLLLTSVPADAIAVLHRPFINMLLTRAAATADDMRPRYRCVHHADPTPIQTMSDLIDPPIRFFFRVKKIKTNENVQRVRDVRNGVRGAAQSVCVRVRETRDSLAMPQVSAQLRRARR